jgi:hypothetical protein
MFPRTIRLLLAFVAAYVLIASAADAQYLYWSGFDVRNGVGNAVVHRADYSGMEEEILVTPGSGAGIALDPESDFLFVSAQSASSPSIVRSRSNGTEVTPLVSGYVRVDGLGVDPVNERLYFHDDPQQRFVSLNNDGFDVQLSVVTGSSIPVQSLAVDGVNRMMYWSQSESLWRAPLDGGPKELLAGPNTTLGLVVHSVALDVSRGHVYWTEWHPDDRPEFFGGRIRRANLDGSEAHTVIHSLLQETEGLPVPYLHPTYLVIDPAANLLFAYNESLATIARANLDGSQFDDDFIGSIGFSPSGLAVFPAVPEPRAITMAMSLVATLAFAWGARWRRTR